MTIEEDVALLQAQVASLQATVAAIVVRSRVEKVIPEGSPLLISSSVDSILAPIAAASATFSYTLAENANALDHQFCNLACTWSGAEPASAEYLVAFSQNWSTLFFFDADGGLLRQYTVSAFPINLADYTPLLDALGTGPIVAA